MADGLAFEDVDEFGRELDNPLAELEQDIVHMLFEAPGSNPDDLTRGAGLIGALSGPTSNIPQIRQRITAALLNDDRITSSRVNVTADANAGEYRIDLELVVDDSVLAFGIIVDGNGGVRRAA